MLQAAQFVMSSNINVTVMGDAVSVAFPAGMETQLALCSVNS